MPRLGPTLLAVVPALALAFAAFPAPAGAAPATLCSEAGADEVCHDLLSSDVRDLAAGWYHNCALLATGDVECWGSDDAGETEGYDGGDAVAVAAGADRSCARLEDGDVTCWGAGDGSPNVPEAVALDVGGFHVCVREGDADQREPVRELGDEEPGGVVCVGRDDYGQAADRPTADAVGVAAGGYHSCALFDNGVSDCWGYDQDDRTDSQASVASVEAGPGNTCVVRTDGSADCFGRSDLGQDASFAGGVAEVTVGGTHVCALGTDGAVECEGDDRYGQAVDDDAGDVQAVAAGYAHTCVLRLDGSVDCWGKDAQGQADDRRPGPLPDLG